MNEDKTKRYFEVESRKGSGIITWGDYLRHEHKWSNKSRYWLLRDKRSGNLFTEKRVPKSRPVWLQECSVCHKIKHAPRSDSSAKRAEEKE